MHPIAKLNSVRLDGPHRAAHRLSALYVLHGLMGSAASWRSVAQRMQQHSVLGEKLSALHCLEMRNHGHSPHMPRHTNALMCSDVEAYIANALHEQRQAAAEASGVVATGKSVLMGHSMGGAVAMAMLIRQANRAQWLPAQAAGAPAGPAALPGDTQDILSTMRAVPDAAEALLGPGPGALGGAVIIDINPLAERPAAIDKIEADLKLLLSLDLTTVRSLSDAHSQLSARGLVDSNMRNFLLTNLGFRRSTNNGGDGAPETFWRCNLQAIVDDLDKFLFNLTPEMAPVPCAVPIVFVYGKNSPYNRPEYRRHVHAFFSNVVDVIEIEGAGHFVHYEKMKEFVDCVAPHVDSFFA